MSKKSTRGAVHAAIKTLRRLVSASHPAMGKRSEGASQQPHWLEGQLWLPCHSATIADSPDGGPQ